jgi:putative transposase
MRNGFLYLTAVIDWFSRYVLSWKLSNSLEGEFCREAVKEALTKGKPEIFNVDQGSQYTCREFVDLIVSQGIRLSMDGKGRCIDNVFVERLWRTVKYEEVYLKDYVKGIEAHKGLSSYFMFYNNERPHQALGYMPPAKLYVVGTGCGMHLGDTKQGSRIYASR